MDKKQKGILNLGENETLLPFLLTEWKTRKYDDGKVTFRFKLLAKKRKNGSVEAVWIENQKRGLFKRFFKRVNARFEYKNEQEYMNALNEIRVDWRSKFGVEGIKIYQPNEMVNSLANQ